MGATIVPRTPVLVCQKVFVVTTSERQSWRKKCTLPQGETRKQASAAIPDFDMR
jgi:hypothetical protein